MSEPVDHRDTDGKDEDEQKRASTPTMEEPPPEKLTVPSIFRKTSSDLDIDPSVFKGGMATPGMLHQIRRQRTLKGVEHEGVSLSREAKSIYHAYSEPDFSQ